MPAAKTKTKASSTSSKPKASSASSKKKAGVMGHAGSKASSAAKAPDKKRSVGSAEGSLDLSATAGTLARLRKSWPALSADMREAFRTLSTDAQRAELGKQTKARGVLTEGARWATQIDEQLRLHPDALDFYTAERFTYFLERLKALHERLDAEEARRRTQGTVRVTALSEREIAARARRQLLGRLLTFAGQREEEQAAIAEAQGTTDTDENLIRSIGSLAKVALSYLAREDSVSALLAKNAGLTKERVEEVVALAKTFSLSASEAALAGARTPRDSPLVNRDEGDVLLEMKEAMRLFEAAREENEAIKRLVPGPATRHVLDRTRRTGAERGGDEPPAQGSRPKEESGSEEDKVPKQEP